MCGRLSSIQQLRKGLADRLHDIQSLAATNAQKQDLIDAEVRALQLQLQAAGQVSVQAARVFQQCTVSETSGILQPFVPERGV